LARRWVELWHAAARVVFAIAPRKAIALSMLKRLREPIVASGGAGTWRWSAWRR
jgi:hypothetical protein